jgi:hypothetical protein
MDVAAPVQTAMTSFPAWLNRHYPPPDDADSPLREWWELLARCGRRLLSPPPPSLDTPMPRSPNSWRAHDPIISGWTNSGIWSSPRQVKKKKKHKNNTSISNLFVKSWNTQKWCQSETNETFLQKLIGKQKKRNQLKDLPRVTKAREQLPIRFTRWTNSHVTHDHRGSFQCLGKNKKGANQPEVLII